MFLTSLYKNRKNEKLWKFPLFEGFSPQLIYILKCLISQWIVFIVYYQISIIILVYHSWLTRKRPISNETPGLEYRRVHLNSIIYIYSIKLNKLRSITNCVQVNAFSEIWIFENHSQNLNYFLKCMVPLFLYPEVIWN